MADQVVDKDHGWRGITRRLLEIDGMEAKAGWISGRPKYPAKRGGTAVARVAGVQFAASKLGDAWDKNESALDAQVDRAYRDALDGKSPTDGALAAARVLADAIRAEVKAVPLFKEGILESQIKAALFGRVGESRRKKWVKGDKP